MAKRSRNDDAQHLHAWCLERLAQHSADSARDPMAAAVRRLAVDLLEGLEDGRFDDARLRALVKHVSDAELTARARRLADAKPEGDWSTVVDAALARLKGAPFAELQAALEAPRAGAVFTAHPTFALSRALREALAAQAIGARVDLAALSHRSPDAITLAYEHEDAAAALARAQHALRGLSGALFDWLERHGDGAWWRIAPAPVRLSTWVGYDLDGRTDIHWAHSLRFRLLEKAAQLRRYVAALEETGVEGALPLAQRLARAADEADAQAGLFDGDLDDPERTVAAANRLTADGPARLVTLEPILDALSALIAAETGARRRALFVVRAEMAAFRLGVAAIHLRVNASQVRSAVQADLGLAASADFMDRRALAAAAERAAEAERQAVNFAAVFQETMTARRQFMLCAQILKHIDADAPIRFLIAEVEAPATIMGAVYLARLYGVSDRLDISPLFETPEVLERGGRFMERLLDEPEYRAYIERRGRLCVQYGFSDSGRFMGQTAADMAIERLHVLLSRAMAARGIRGVEALIFNTHGESMGRGAFPGAMGQRLDYLLTPWVRTRFAHDGAPLHAEISFQGGDGYLHFQNATLSDATLRAVFAWAFAAPAEKSDDAFYADINFSWDVYRAVKTWQEDLFANPHYQAVLGAFGVGLLPVIGSRKSRRQSGASKDDAARALRAIPHNAILQQLAAPANVSGGFGRVAAREPERFLAHVAGSPRLKMLVDLALSARRRTSLLVLRTYADIYSPSFWTIRAARSADDDDAATALRIAARAEQRGLDIALDRLANFLSDDRRRFDAVCRELMQATTGDAAFPKDLSILHAVRMAFMVRGFVLAASAPPFSGRHEITRADLIDMALDLRFAEVADLIDEIFPMASDMPAAFTRLDEPGQPTAPSGYPEINRDIAAPLRALDAALKEITVGVSHFYDAIG
ncbi:MAG: phosphoenolpyruvate carboxylase [Alphaproteobacteria bacterium]|nr:phosphoenolpyruvate carboxylase [Alphaproteobacteria bacterium]